MGNGFTAPIDVEFRATGVEGVRNGLRLVKTESEAMSHSTMIGLGELTRGLSRIGESGEASAFAIRELTGATMRLGGALGPAGGLAAIVLMLGATFYEVFSKARKEMEDTRVKFEEELGRMANAGQSGDLQRKLRDLMYGTPYDEKGQMRGPTNTPGVFAGSILALQSRIAAARSQLLPSGYLTNDLANAPINKAIKDLEAQLKPLNEQAFQLETAIMNIASQPATMGMLGMKTTALSDAAQKKNDDHLQKLIDFITGINTHNTLAQMGAKVTPGLGGYVGPMLGGTRSILGEKGPMVAKITETVGQVLADAQVKIVEQINGEFTHGIEDALANGLEAAFSSRNIKDLGKNFLKGMLETLGDIAIRLGEAMLPIAGWLSSFTSALLSLNGPAAIAAGIGLIIAGSALKAGASSIGSHSGGGGSSYSAGVGYASSVVVNPNLPAPTSAGTSPVHVTVIGKDDPQAQRQIMELMARAQRRGSVSG